MQQRKAVLAAILTIVMLISGLTPVAAETTNSIGILVNNQAISRNPPSAYSNGIIYVPAREFAGALGGSFSYDSKLMAGTVRQGENELVFRLDDSIVKMNGKYIQAPGAMKILENRFMIPAEFTAKQLGAEIYLHTWKNKLMVFQPSGGKLVYQVMSGDTLWMISSIFGVSITSIRQLNGLTSDMLYIGQKLVIKNFSTLNAVYPAQTSKSATIKSSASWSASEVGYLAAWTNISVVGKNGDWYKVTTPKGNGYIYYTVVSVKQEISDTASNSKYFDNQIPIDTSKDYITYLDYTVKKGDSIWSISQAMGLPDYELAQANSISLYTTLYEGQKLKVPVHNIPVKATAGAKYGELLDWFKEAQYVFPVGKVGKLTDLETGKSFMVKRTMGANHSDTETLTVEDTNTMKQIFGGTWTWSRRPFILEVDGRKLAVSVAGMPHAGVDGVPYLQNVDNRSDNWGSGPNYDAISGNGMDGHFDLYFMNGLRHKDNAIDPGHQYSVLVAGGLQ